MYNFNLIRLFNVENDHDEHQRYYHIKRSTDIMHKYLFNYLLYVYVCFTLITSSVMTYYDCSNLFEIVSTNWKIKQYLFSSSSFFVRKYQRCFFTKVSALINSKNNITYNLINKCKLLVLL